jgi:hypothetical protein
MNKTMEKEMKNIKWGEFFIEDIFNIKAGKRLTKTEMKHGKMPFIGASDSNNGITNFVSNTNSSLDSNVLGVNYNGSVVENFYHPYKAIFSDDVKRLSLKDAEGNKFLYLFIKMIILKQKSKFQYAYKFNQERMLRQKILLPINSKGEPDYAFMEHFMRQKEQEKFEKFQNYIAKRIEQVKDFKEVEPLNQKEWAEFKINEFFKYEKGDQNNMATIKKGEIPLISAKKGENGYKDFAAKVNKNLYSKNSLTLNNDGDGGAGISYYQPTDYLLDSHVTALYSKSELNKHILLFFSRCITAQRNKFGHGYSITNNRLNAFKIMLPIDKEGQPDYEYMENYIKKIEYQKLKKYYDLKFGIPKEKQKSSVEILQNSPLVGVDLDTSRQDDLPRDIDFS